LAGGGALIQGLDVLLANVLKLPIYIADDPLSAVARGTGVVFEDIDYFKDVLLKSNDELPLR
jgi:rod shape-determining protein MreB